ncbi:hypothetical protein BHF71_09505 [Vulcanibacillus modesticaldus]|uniref:SHSP domain-containing protein n=2 Tax=Vulcanibacillus modesticaldus TaxID=337097 RepID=A0A1D2YU35_9BACI|nr:hypothetical protein BHF71_09505 [Vulcanibacillus modesticaldus]
MNELEKIFNELEKSLISYFNKYMGTYQKWKQFLKYDSNLPNVKVKEHDNMIDIFLEVPSLSKDHQLRAKLFNDHLIVYGTLDRYNEVKSNYGESIRESYSEYFYQTIQLPAKVSKEGARAEYDKGILRIQLKKINELNQDNAEIDIDFR